MPIPRGGTLRNFFFQNFGGATTGVTIVLRVNGVNTALQCVTNSSGTCTDTTDTVTIATGDAITVDATSNTNKPGVWGVVLQ